MLFLGDGRGMGVDEMYSLAQLFGLNVIQLTRGTLWCALSLVEV